ncbi:MAG TPA: PASTA domain-containing protein [Spirochaetes bacterium]|nr:PASTA domain-containing protein [Spirochaetota bacterium]
MNKTEFKYFKPVGRLLMIFFVGFSFYLLVSTVVLLFLTKPEKEIAVPGVTGKYFNDVYNSLVRRGLKPELKFYDAYDIEPGIVLEQYPEKGDIVYEGSIMKLVVSRGIQSIDVPSLVGVELPFALNKLRNLHSYNRTVSLSVGVISYVPSEKTAENIVINQSPKAGEKVGPDRRVNLLVSAGKIDGEMKMPGVTGQSVDLCMSLLFSRGLGVNQEIVPTGQLDQSGTVTGQNPPADAAVKKGDTVTLRVLYYKPVEHAYRNYERVEFTVPGDKGAGLYEASIEDDAPRRIAYSREMKPGQKIDFIFHRSGNARINITRDKRVIKVIRIKADDIP